jgi:hypothetical protein
MHDIFAGREHQIPPREKIYTRTLGSAGDLTIYEINPLCESIGEDHGEISSFFETPVSQCIPKHGGRVSGVIRYWESAFWAETTIALCRSSFP